jgi:hypothetical protein
MTPEIRVELVLEGANAEQRFQGLKRRQEEIETALGSPRPFWHNPEDQCGAKSM